MSEWGRYIVHFFQLSGTRRLHKKRTIEETEIAAPSDAAARMWAVGYLSHLKRQHPVSKGFLTFTVSKKNPRGSTRIRVGRKSVAIEDATIGQLQIAALKAMPHSPYQLAIRAEIDRRHARGEKAWTPPPGHRWAKKNPRETTTRYERIRIRSPKQFVTGSFRTIDPGRRGHTKLVIGRLKKGKRVTRGRRKGRPAMTVQAVLRERKPGRIVKSRRRNPSVAVLGNPPRGARHLGRATRLEYTHEHDGKAYYHDFEPAANVTVTDNGRVVLWHPQHKLWDLFDVK